MNTVFEPKLDMPVGAVPPDAYDESLGSVPPDDFVVSRHRDGLAASSYGELCWNLSAYHPEGRTSTLNFAYWVTGEITPSRDQIAREARFLLFSLMWLRKGSPLSIGTLRNYLSVVSAMAQYAEDTSCQIQDLLGEERRLWSFVETRCSGWMTQTLGSLLPLLASSDHGQLGFDIVGDKLLRVVRTRGRQYRTTLKQHAPLPTRIYTRIINQLLKELTEWEPVAEDMLAVLQACGEDPRMGRTIDQQCETAKKLGISHVFHPTFKQLAPQSCLDYFSAKERRANVKSLSVLITEIQLAAKLTIQTFTGMRDDEALSLPYHCLETTVANGKTHYIILGRTTKLNNGRVKRTRWVTNQDGHRAIRLVQKIADAIYAVFGVVVRKATTRTNDHPLFVSVGYLALAGQSLKPEGGHFRAGQINLERMTDFRTRLEPVIEDTDICELEQINPHRAWRSDDKFQIGQPWLFTSHQLRRSLALYAQRSGLVSLPSLRRQLQHITDEMSRYYAKGSSFAKDFIGDDKEHFGLEWQETQPESAALSYILNVLLSDDVLFGGHANWVAHRLKGPDGTVVVDREVTLRRFKKGEMAYRETLIGGCTNVLECDQIALKWLDVDCLSEGCRNMVCNLTKLQRVISAQAKMVSALDQNSVEYRTEKSDLEVLVTARDRVVQKRNGDIT